MRAITSVCLAAVAAGLLWLPRSAAAQSPPDANALQQQIDQLKKEFGERIAALEAKLAEAQAAPQTPAPVPAVPGGPDTATQAAPLANAKVFNPDISVIGNFLGVAGKNDHSDQPPFGLSEVGSVVPGRRRSVRARGFLPRRRSRGRRKSKKASSPSTRCRPACCSRPARCARSSARSTRCTRTRCRGPIGRWSRRTWSAARKAFRLPGVSLSRLIHELGVVPRGHRRGLLRRSSDVFESRRASRS